MLWTVRTVTLRLSPPVYKLGGREFCVVFSCVVSRESTVRPMESGAQHDALGWTPLGGVDRLSQYRGAMAGWFWQSASPPSMVVSQEGKRSSGGINNSDMVVNSGPDRDSIPLQPHAGSGIILDYGALKHLKWSPRRQPERVVEVSRAIRDVVDRSKLRKILQHPAPSRKVLRDQFKALGIDPSKQQQWEQEGKKRTSMVG